MFRPALLCFRSSSIRTPLLLGITSVLLGACGGSNSSRAPDAQVVARVNHADITVHQVQHAMQRLPRGGGVDLARTVLGQLVEQELSAQAAKEQGLDREASVVQALVAAQREVLARAWQDRLASAVVQPSTDEIDRYYDDHPELFAERRLYALQEYLIEPGANRAVLEQIASDTHGRTALEDALAQAKLKYRGRQFALAAEDLPLGLVRPLAGLDAGEALVLPPLAGNRVYLILHAEMAPMDRRSAKDAIGGFLVAERKRAAVAEGMKAVRSKARVEYRGSFAAPASAAAASAAR